jgi:ABC-2 type transport system permease protein
MSGSRRDESTSRRSGFPFELLKVQSKLALREPYALLGGLALPAVLLALFGFIGKANPGNVGDSGLTVIDLWTPTLLVISLLIISVSLPNTLVRDREIGWLRRVSTTPLHPSRLLAAQLIIDLVLAVAAVVIIIGGGALVFGASLHMQILPFGLSLVLTIAEMFALGMVLVAFGADTGGRATRHRGDYIRFDVPFGSVG